MKNLAWWALIAVCFFWGTTYFAIRIVVETISPLFLSGVRHVLAGLVLVSIYKIRGVKFPTHKQLVHAFISGLMLVGGANILISFAEKHVSSGVTALICAMLPLFVWLLSLGVASRVRYTIGSLAGILVGMVGLGVLFYDQFAELLQPQYFMGVVCVLLANISWAAGTLYLYQTPTTLPSVYFAGWQMLSVGTVITLVSLVHGDFGHISSFTSESIWAMGYLVVFGSVVGYTSFVYATHHLPPAVSSLYAYINPLVAILLGWVFLEEQVSLSTFMALGLVLASVYLIKNSFENK